ncbi:MAG: hypothetical protein CBD03_00705 [Rhizobiales bacterium TMED143]|nr:hypothetical protein [Rhodobiaceae bacterium]OUV93144.1 MAG: hypothetical protein CBD03_00705 [Rhizobiales bacterium TMED143]HCQ81183.1 hypothetical protein [Rhodobiaceae bacterium]|tara:strand:+ start:81 stop:626 length:546 start_codon:yes stop_codon:yes gene_type:complete
MNSCFDNPVRKVSDTIMPIKSKWIPVLLLLPLLAACGGRDIAPERCPSGGVLATAESLPAMQGTGVDGKSAEIYGVTVACSRGDNGSEAVVTVYGELFGVQDTNVTIFAGLVDKDEAVQARTQKDVRVGQGRFEIEMPALTYSIAELGAVDLAAFLAGFVLTPEQLEANRSEWRDNLNIKK